MTITQTMTKPCMIAVCRESLDDDNEWSIYALNQLAEPAILIVEHADWEWGDMGHSKQPRLEVPLPGNGAARVMRVDGSDAELRMSVTLLFSANGVRTRLSFELGMLYRYQDPKVLGMSGLTGWLREAVECRSV